MKRAFILMPLLMPRLSDHAAAQLLDILEQLLQCVQHHYAPQIHRWHRRQFRARPPGEPPLPLFPDVPF